MPQAIIYDLVILLNYEHRNISSGLIVIFIGVSVRGIRRSLKYFL